MKITSAILEELLKEFKRLQLENVSLKSVCKKYNIGLEWKEGAKRLTEETNVTGGENHSMNDSTVGDKLYNSIHNSLMFNTNDSTCSENSFDLDDNLSDDLMNEIFTNWNESYYNRLMVPNVSGINLTNEFSSKKILPDSEYDSRYAIGLNGSNYSDTISMVSEENEFENISYTNELTYQAIIECSSDAIFCNDRKGIYKFVNSHFASIFGKKPEYFIGKSFWDVFSKSNADYRFDAVTKVFETGKSFCFEVEVPAQNKTLTYYSTVNPIKDKTGKVIFALTHSKNIDQLKRTKEKLRDRDKLIETIVNLSPDVIYIFDLVEQRTVYSNKGITKTLGYSSLEIIEMGEQLLPSVMHPEDYRRYIEVELPKYSTLKNGEVLTDEFRARHKNGKWLWLQSKETIYSRNSGGNPITIFGVIRDVTILKTSEEEVKQKNMQLLHANNEKNKFFSILAHDLRSPFQGFLGITQMLAEESASFSSEEFAKFSSNLYESAQNLYAKLKNLLDWARMQNGTMSFQPEYLSLLSVIEESIYLLKEAAQKKSIKIINNVVQPIIVFYDEKMLNSIFSNILSNSIKFTKQNGTVTINLTEENEEMYVVSISDSGIGMDEMLKNNLFKIGEKTSRKGTEGEPSIGLGLLLCKEFIEKHGGEIRVESSEEKGTTFTFTLPII